MMTVLRNPLSLIGAIVVLLAVLVAVFAPLIAPYDPNAINLAARFQPPSIVHWAGTDEVGRDLFSRLVFGARASIGSGMAIVFIAVTFGTFIGCLAGYLGGWTDTVVMRLVEMVMALPGLVVALALTAALGPSLVNAVLALGVLMIPFYVRLARGETLRLRELGFVRAARAMGASPLHQLAHNILPNIIPTLVIFVSLHMGGAILAAGALSFVGLGAQPPLAEWGTLINAGRGYILDQWWYSLFPGIAIVLTALGFNLLGDGLREAFDPKVHDQ